MKKWIDKIKNKLNLSNKLKGADIGIDLGTANTLVYVNGKGVVIDEPSIVAFNKKTEQVVAVGKSAKVMLGRTPQHIEAVRPIIDGVISNYEVTEEMLSYLIRKAQGGKTIIGPRVVVGVPSGITNVEMRAVQDAAKASGAKEVYIIEEPMAAAIGSGLPVLSPQGSMIVDIGGGTTDIGVISLGGLVSTKNITIAGDKFNEDIKNFIRSEFKLLIGDKTAENIKIATASYYPSGEKTSIARGRDVLSGLPKELIISDKDVHEAIKYSLDKIIEATKELLETTPPELISDIKRTGIYLAGGGALINGLDKAFEERLKVPVKVTEDPLVAVAKGAGAVLSDIDKYKDALIIDTDEIKT